MISASRPFWDVPLITIPLAEHVEVGGIHLPPVPVTLLHDLLLVAASGERVRLEVAGLGSQPHRGAEVGHVLLLGQRGRSRGAASRGELRRVGVLEAAHVPGELDRRTAAEADPEERDASLAGEPRVHLALDAADPEAAGDQDPVGAPSASSVASPPRSSEAIQSITTSAPWWIPPWFSASITDR